MSKYVMLKPEEVNELVTKAQSGHSASRDRLVRAFLPRVGVIARKFTEFGVEYDDAYQVGAMAFAESINNYDSTKGKFSTYAESCARFQMIHLIYAKETFSRNTRMQRQVKRVRKVIADLKRRNLPVTEQQVSKETQIGLSEVKLVMWLAFQRLVSFQDEVGSNEAGGGRSLSDVIADDAPNPEDILIDFDLAETRNQRLREALASLSDRESDIVCRRKGLYGLEPETLGEISDRYSISRERVRQIENKALAKLNRYMRKHKREVAF